MLYLPANAFRESSGCWLQCLDSAAHMGNWGQDCKSASSALVWCDSRGVSTRWKIKSLLFSSPPLLFVFLHSAPLSPFLLSISLCLTCAHTLPISPVFVSLSNKEMHLSKYKYDTVWHYLIRWIVLEAKEQDKSDLETDLADPPPPVWLLPCVLTASLHIQLPYCGLKGQ